MDLPSFLGALFTKERKRAPQKKEIQKIEEDIAHLKQHPIFNELAIIETIRLNSLKIKDQTKKKMAVAYLQISFGEINSMVISLINEYPQCLQSSSTISTRIYQTMKSIRQKAMSEGVATIFLDKYEPRSFEVLSIITNIIIEVHQNRLINDDYTSMCLILSMFLAYVRISMEQVEGIVDNMNGELSCALSGSVFDK